MRKPPAWPPLRRPDQPSNMRFLVIGLCVAVCLAQSPGNQIYTLSAIAGDGKLISKNILLDPPLTLTTSSTKYLHLGINIPDTSFAGEDFIVATDPVTGARQVFVNTARISFRSPIIPTGPGPCLIGTAGWNADESGLYYCIANHDPGTQTAAPFTWAQPHRYSIPDPDNAGQWIWGASLR